MLSPTNNFRKIFFPFATALPPATPPAGSSPSSFEQRALAAHLQATPPLSSSLWQNHRVFTRLFENIELVPLGKATNVHPESLTNGDTQATIVEDSKGTPSLKVEGEGVWLKSSRSDLMKINASCQWPLSNNDFIIIAGEQKTKIFTFKRENNEWHLYSVVFSSAKSGPLTDNKGKLITPYTDRPFLIGSDEGSDLRFSENDGSIHRCIIHPPAADGTMTLEVGSQNGVYVRELGVEGNGKWIQFGQTSPLRPGDEIGFQTTAGEIIFLRVGAPLIGIGEDDILLSTPLNPNVEASHFAPITPTIPTPAGYLIDRVDFSSDPRVKFRHAEVILDPKKKIHMIKGRKDGPQIWIFMNNQWERVENRDDGYPLHDRLYVAFGKIIHSGEDNTHLLDPYMMEWMEEEDRGRVEWLRADEKSYNYIPPDEADVSGAVVCRFSAETGLFDLALEYTELVSQPPLEKIHEFGEGHRILNQDGMLFLVGGVQKKELLRVIDWRTGQALPVSEGQIMSLEEGDRITLKKNGSPEITIPGPHSSEQNRPPLTISYAVEAISPSEKFYSIRAFNHYSHVRNGDFFQWSPVQILSYDLAIVTIRFKTTSLVPEKKEDFDEYCDQWREACKKLGLPSPSFDHITNFKFETLDLTLPISHAKTIGILDGRTGNLSQRHYEFTINSTLPAIAHQIIKNDDGTFTARLTGTGKAALFRFNSTTNQWEPATIIETHSENRKTFKETPLYPGDILITSASGILDPYTIKKIGQTLAQLAQGNLGDLENALWNLMNLQVYRHDVPGVYDKPFATLSLPSIEARVLRVISKKLFPNWNETSSFESITPQNLYRALALLSIEVESVIADRVRQKLAAILRRIQLSSLEESFLKRAYRKTYPEAQSTPDFSWVTEDNEHEIKKLLNLFVRDSQIARNIQEKIGT